MATITSPVPGWKGTVAGLEFEDGKATTDDERLLAYFTEAGYDVQGASGYEVQFVDEKPAPSIGTVMGLDVEVPPLADAADPRNDLVPVGGVKSDGTIVAPAKDGDGEDVAPKPEPAKDVQETGNPDEQSAVPTSANPAEAVSTPDGAEQPVARDYQPGADDPSAAEQNPSATDETGAPSADASPSGEASQDASGGIISSDPAPEQDSSGKHAADQPADGTTPAKGSSKKGDS